MQHRSAWEEPIGISLVNDEEADLVTDSRLVGVHEATRVAQCLFRQIGDSKRGHDFLQAYCSQVAVKLAPSSCAYGALTPLRTVPLSLVAFTRANGLWRAIAERAFKLHRPIKRRRPGREFALLDRSVAAGRWTAWGDRQDELANLLDFVLASGGNYVARDGLGREQRRPCSLNLGFGRGPFAVVEPLRGKLREEPVGAGFTLAGRSLESLPELPVHSNVLADGRGHHVSPPVVLVSVPERRFVQDRAVVLRRCFQ